MNAEAQECVYLKYCCCSGIRQLRNASLPAYAKDCVLKCGDFFKGPPFPFIKNCTNVLAFGILLTAPVSTVCKLMPRECRDLSYFNA